MEWIDLTEYMADSMRWHGIGYGQILIYLVTYILMEWVDMTEYMADGTELDIARF